MAAAKLKRYAYVPAVPHKQGGFTCQHADCAEQAVVSEALVCVDDCETARSEADARLEATTWDHLAIPEREHLQRRLAAGPTEDDDPAEWERLQARLHQLDDEQAQRIAEARAEWHSQLQDALTDHTHQHYRCTDHAADLGAHVTEAVTRNAEAR